MALQQLPLFIRIDIHGHRLSSDALQQMDKEKVYH